jgi:hypothetical protein
LTSFHTNEKEKTMLSNDPAEKPQQSASSSGGAETPVLSPQDPIEVGSQGSGTINDPGASDTKPPGVSGDLGDLSYLA